MPVMVKTTGVKTPGALDNIDGLILNDSPLDGVPSITQGFNAAHAGQQPTGLDPKPVQTETISVTPNYMKFE